MPDDVARMPAPSAKAPFLIDFQRDFLADDARLPVDRSQVEPVIAAANAAICDAERDGDLIVAIGNEYRRSDWLLNMLRRGAAIRGSAGAAWDERIAVSGAVYVAKWRNSAFCNPTLTTVLEQHDISRIAVTGLFARACVTATARDARSHGLDVVVLADAVACASERSRRRALTRLAGGHRRTARLNRLRCHAVDQLIRVASNC